MNGKYHEAKERPSTWWRGLRAEDQKKLKQALTAVTEQNHIVAGTEDMVNDAPGCRERAGERCGEQEAQAESIVIQQMMRGCFDADRDQMRSQPRPMSQRCERSAREQVRDHQRRPELTAGS